MCMNRERMGEEKFQEMLKRAITHLKFCCELYELQVKAGRYFLHEHPVQATSWRLPCIQRVLALPGVHTCIGDMCRFGMWLADGEGPGLVRKTTKF